MQSNGVTRYLIVGVLVGAGIWALCFWGGLFIQLGFFAAPLELWQPVIMLSIALLGLLAAIVVAFLVNAYRTGRLGALFTRRDNANARGQAPAVRRSDEDRLLPAILSTTRGSVTSLSKFHALTLGVSTLTTVVMLAALTFLSQQDNYPMFQAIAAVFLAALVLGCCLSLSAIR